MGSIGDFNKKAALGNDAARQYCKIWSGEIDARGKELTEQLKSNKIDRAVYNIRRVSLNKEVKDLNNCIEKLNTI